MPCIHTCIHAWIIIPIDGCITNTPQSNLHFQNPSRKFGNWMHHISICLLRMGQRWERYVPRRSSFNNEGVMDHIAMHLTTEYEVYYRVYFVHSIHNSVDRLFSEYWLFSSYWLPFPFLLWWVFNSFGVLSITKQADVVSTTFASESRGSIQFTMKRKCWHRDETVLGVRYLSCWPLHPAHFHSWMRMLSSRQTEQNRTVQRILHTRLPVPFNIIYPNTLPFTSSSHWIVLWEEHYRTDHPQRAISLLNPQLNVKAIFLKPVPCPKLGICIRRWFHAATVPKTYLS